eukprot:2725764-Prorocentrum_lima.AAC.1
MDPGEERVLGGRAAALRKGAGVLVNLYPRPLYPECVSVPDPSLEGSFLVSWEPDHIDLLRTVSPWEFCPRGLQCALHVVAPELQQECLGGDAVRLVKDPQQVLLSIGVSEPRPCPVEVLLAAPCACE